MKIDKKEFNQMSNDTIVSYFINFIEETGATASKYFQLYIMPIIDYLFQVNIASEFLIDDWHSDIKQDVYCTVLNICTKEKILSIKNLKSYLFLIVRNRIYRETNKLTLRDTTKKKVQERYITNKNDYGSFYSYVTI
jgi:hypothetical protein